MAVVEVQVLYQYFKKINAETTFHKITEGEKVYSKLQGEKKVLFFSFLESRITEL